MSKQVSLTLLGTGSSGGVPRVGGDWGACDPLEPRNRRRRCSALFETFRLRTPADRTRVLVDTSPDLREQLLDSEVDHLDAVVFTHDHADQTHGIDDLRPLALRQRSQVPAYLDAPTAKTLLPKFRYCFEGDGGYPPILDLQPHLVPLVPIEISGPGGSISMRPLQQQHGRIVSLGFRVGPIAYCNDVSGLPDETLQALKDLDTLVIDALRYTPHPSHANLAQALDWVEALAPRRAILTNLHVDMDYAALKVSLPKSVEPGYDGMVINAPL